MTLVQSFSLTLNLSSFQNTLQLLLCPSLGHWSPLPSPTLSQIPFSFRQDRTSQPSPSVGMLLAGSRKLSDAAISFYSHHLAQGSWMLAWLGTSTQYQFPHHHHQLGLFPGDRLQ